MFLYKSTRSGMPIGSSRRSHHRFPSQPGDRADCKARDTLIDLSGRTLDALLSDQPHDAAARSITASNPSSSFCGLFTRLEIGHIFIGSDRNVISKSCGSGSLPSHLS
jgi:hypothetical protein